MKKILVVLFLISVLLVSGCSPQNVEVKNGFINLSVNELEKSFNSQLSADYAKARFEKQFADSELSCYSCDLGNGIEFSVLATPDAKMIESADLSFDMNADSASAHNLGYYYAKLIYAVAPDITSDEIIDIAAKIKMDSPAPGLSESTERKNILYVHDVDEDNIISLIVIGYK